jgi:CheY-like chemotaxis protein
MAHERKPRVLVVDDDALVRKALIASLEDECEVAEAASASEALERFDDNDRFDVILCDLLMPGMTGMDFYVELVRRGSQAMRAVVFMSGAVPPEARAFIAGIENRCLEKPIDPRELRRVVRHLAGLPSWGAAP